jgi:type IV secretion system protein VirD4
VGDRTVAAITIALLIFIFLLFIRKLSKNNATEKIDDKYRREAQLKKYLNELKWSAFNKPDSTGISYIFGDNKRYYTDKHFCTIMPTRCGKGRGLILPNLLDNPEISFFVIDPKGENALVSARYRQRQGHDILIFNPYGIWAEEFAARGFTQFQSFNPLANLNPESPDFADDVATLAEALIYETGGDSHWVDSARGLVEFLIMYLVTEPAEEGNRTLRRLRAIIAGGHQALLKILPLCETSDLDLVRDNVGRYELPTPEVLSVISTAETQTRMFKSKVICAALEGGAFDFGSMKDRKTSVYLILPSARLITQARYLRLVLLVAMSQFMRSEKGVHQVAVIADEFSNLGPLKVVESGYGLIAGHGVTLWSYLQNLTQLKNLYPNNWPVFLANSAAVTVSNVNDVETAEYFSKRAGRKEVTKTSQSQGRSTQGFSLFGNTHESSNTSDVWEDSLPVSDLYNAKPDTLFLFLEGKAEPIEVPKLRYDFDEPFKSRADKNPMHKQ